jgi:glycosyltransferase involved in cell wall biosynthesis
MERASAVTPLRLQVLIATFGPEGMRRIEAMSLPRIAGVEYLVGWQLPEGDIPVGETIGKRADIRVFKSRERGLARNRNFVMARAEAPWCLLSDDDLRYTEASLKALLEAIDANPQADIICCAYTCRGRFMKPYPAGPVPLERAPRGWYANSFEIAYRRVGPAGAVRFNVNFGVCAPLFRAGEEDIFLCDARRAGARGLILPLVLCAHDHDSTAERDGDKDWFVMTQGAVHKHLHPLTWPMRLFRHALCQKRMSKWRYFRLAMRGASVKLPKEDNG